MSDTRVISLNVQRRRGESPEALRERMQHSAHWLQKEEPDILCIQEALPDGWPSLTDVLKPKDAVFCPRQDGATAGEGVGILCFGNQSPAIRTENFWFSETPGEPSKSWRAAHPRVCTALCIEIEHQPTWWLSLHLDHRSALARAQSLELLNTWLDAEVPPDTPLVVAGDFNLAASNTVFKQWLSKQPRLRSATENHPLAALKPTFRGLGPFNWAKARIDHCLHSPQWTCTHYEAQTPRHLGRPLSDHRALLVDLSLS